MTMRKRRILGACLLGLWSLCSVGLGASLNGLSVWWHTIAGGGGRSTGGNYALDGSVGQPIVDSSSGAGYGVSAGFWTYEGAQPPVATPTGPVPITPTPTRTLPSGPTPTHTLPSGPTPTHTLPPGPTPTHTLPSGPTPTLPIQPCPNFVPGGDFEGGLQPPWALFGDAQITTARAHGGGHSVQLLGSDNASGEVGAGTELPPDATQITLSLWWYVESSDPNPYADMLTVVVGGPGGEVPLGSYDNTAPRNTWQHSSYDLSSRAGQPLGLTLVANSDPANVTTFFVDDIELQVCAGPAPGGLRLYLPIVVRSLWR